MNRWDERPRPFRGRCPLCSWRSRRGFESVALAEGAASAHLLLHHGLSVERIAEMLHGSAPRLVEIGTGKERTTI